MLACRGGSLYTGITNDLPRRLEAHKKGRGSKLVRSRLPFRLVRVERAATKGAALSREAEIKRMGRIGKLKLVGGGKVISFQWSVLSQNQKLTTDH